MSGVTEASIPVNNAEGDVPSKVESIYTNCIQNYYSTRFRYLLALVPVFLIPLYAGSTKETWLVNLALVLVGYGYFAIGVYQTRTFESRQLSHDELRPWQLVLYPMHIFLGLLFNVIFIHLYYFEINNAMEYLFLIAAGFSAGTVGTCQYVKGLSSTFITAAILPQALFHLYFSEYPQPLIGLSMLIFMGFMIKLSGGMHREAITRLHLNYELQKAREHAEHLAWTDSLSELYNRRAFYELGRKQVATACRHQKSLSLILLDIDHFKSINDKFGHSCGDAAIKRISRHMLQVTRTGDIAARVGGEEFCILLPETNKHDAEILAERLRVEIEKDMMEFKDNHVDLTISIGVAQLGDAEGDIDVLMMKADKALYVAKDNGRNQVVMAG